MFLLYRNDPEDDELVCDLGHLSVSCSLLWRFEDFLGPFWGDEKEKTDLYLVLDSRLVMSCLVAVAACALASAPYGTCSPSIVKELGIYISCWHGDIL